MLIACITSDIFRINAPDHPFSPSQLKAIFGLWLRHFQLLVEPKEKDKAIFEMVFYVLERTAVVKSFVVLTDPQLECDGETEQLFDLFLNRINPAHFESEHVVHKHMEVILQSILDETDTITPDLLGTIQSNLCGARRKNKTHGYQLAKSIIDHTGDKLQATLSHVMETDLNDNFQAAAKFDMADMAESTKHRQKHLDEIRRNLELLEELEVIHPVFLGPKLTPFLETPSEDLRHMTVETVCNIFRSHPFYCKTYASVFAHFLARSMDRSKKIRARMLVWFQEMMTEDDTFRDTYYGKILEALEDKEDVIRRQAVNTAAEIARRHPLSVPKALITGLAKVCRSDRKALVRMHCMQKLCTLYAELAPGWMDGGPTLSKLRQMYQWIPPVIMSFYTLDSDHEIKEAVLRLIHAMLPPTTKGKSKAEVDGIDQGAPYAKAFVGLYRCLDIQTPCKSNCLQEVLAAKASLRKTVSEFVRLRSVLKNDKAPPEDKRLYDYHIAQLTDKTASLRSDWLELAKLRDEKIFKCLASLVDPMAVPSMAEAITLKEQVVSKVKAATKSEQLGVFAQTLVAKLLFPVAPEHVEAMLRQMEDATPETMLAIMGALSTLAEVLPSLVSSSVEQLAAFVVSWTASAACVADCAILRFALRALGRAGGPIPQNGASHQKLLKTLKGLCLSGSPDVRKLALHCINRTTERHMEVFKTVAAGLGEQLVVGRRGTPSLLGTLKGLQVLFSLCPAKDWAGVSKAVLKFVKADVLQHYTATQETGENWADPPYECTAWAQGIKVLGSYVMHSEEDPADQIKFLFNLFKQLNDNLQTVSSSYKLTCLFKGVVKLLCQPRCRRLILPTHLRLLMVANIFESNEHARQDMRDVVHQYLLSGKLPMKYCWMLIVNVLDHNKRNAAMAKDQVNRVIMHYREQQRRFDKSGQKISLSDQQAVLICPEYILPDLLYQLAHYPAFEDHHPNYEPIQTCFYVFFEAITRDTDNVSFFYKLLQILKRYDDRLQPKSKNTKVLCDIAFDIVHNEYGKTRQSSGKPFPGTVNVPAVFCASKSVEDDTTVYMPSTFKLMGKARALKAIPLDQMKPEKTETSPAKEQAANKRPANAVSCAGTPAKRRKVASAPEDEDSDMGEPSPRRSTRIRA